MNRPQLFAMLIKLDGIGILMILVKILIHIQLDMVTWPWKLFKNLKVKNVMVKKLFPTVNNLIKIGSFKLGF